MIVHLKRTASPLLEKLKAGTGYRVWQAGGGHDLNIWTMRKAIEKAEYCHTNPVKRKIATSPERWRWSSFRWLVQGCREGEPLQIDPWNEPLLEEGGTSK